MPRTYQKKGLRGIFDPNAMKEAILAVRRGMSIQKAAEIFKVPRSTLGKHYKNLKPGEVTYRDLLGGGRKIELKKEDENSLAEFLKVAGNSGFGLAKDEILDLMKQFIKEKQIVTRWGADNGPGEEWFRGFMIRHPFLARRKRELLSNQRVRGADPYTIQNFYQSVQELYTKEGIGPESGALIYNCD